MSDPWSRGHLVANVLIQAGFSTYFVGGCVRDHLLGRAVADVDLCTAATPDQVASLFAKCLLVGKAFGVAVVVLPDGGQVEVATFRTDGLYIDGRRPSQVTFATVEEDVARRDFTLNALLMDPADGRIIDHVGGRRDLEQRLLRVVGDPGQRLAEDRLRVLRGIRFAAGLGLSWDPSSWTAVCATSLAGLSGERIVQEIGKGLACAHPDAWLRMLFASGHGSSLFFGLAMEAAAEALARCPASSTSDQRWIVLLAHLPDASAWSERHPLAKEQVRRWRSVLSMLGRWSAAGIADRRRMLQDPLAPLLADSARALDPTSTIPEALTAEQAGGPFIPLLRPADLLALGIPPGPGLGRIQALVTDAQLEHRITSRAEAEALVARLHPPRG